MKLRFSKIIVITALILLSGIGANSASAIAQADLPPPAKSTDYTLLTPIPGQDQNVVVSKVDTTDPLSYVQGLFRIFVALAIGLSVIVLAYGGITYMTSDAVTLKSKGKEIIKRSLWGLLLLLTSFLIINTINPNALNLEKFFQTSSSTTTQDPVSANDKTFYIIQTESKNGTKNTVNFDTIESCNQYLNTLKTSSPNLKIVVSCESSVNSSGGDF